MIILFKGIPMGAGGFRLLMSVVGVILAVAIVVGLIRALVVGTAWFGMSVGSRFGSFGTDADLLHVPRWLYVLTYLLTLATGIGGFLFLIRWMTWWDDSVLLGLLLIAFPIGWVYGMLKFWRFFSLRLNSDPKESRTILIFIIILMAILWTVMILINAKMNLELDLLRQSFGM